MCEGEGEGEGGCRRIGARGRGAGEIRGLGIRWGGSWGDCVWGEGLADAVKGAGEGRGG